MTDGRADFVGNLRVGDEGPGFEWGPISRTDIVRYAGAGGDFNAVHHDEPFAQSKGYASVFAMGLFPAGVLARVVTDWFGLGRLRSYSVRFTALVLPGDTLRYSAWIVAIREEPAGLLADLQTRAETIEGETKLVGTATVMLDA